jgi:multidrug resistance efflux pump
MLIEKETKMTKPVSTLAAALKQARIDLANAKLEVARLAAGVKQERENAKAAKAEAKATKQAAAIAKAQARLQKLLEKQAAPVGIKAKKAAKRPSKAVVTKFGAEDNAIAAAIMARKATA